MTIESALPSNRTPFELAVSTVSAERRALPAHLVSDIWNPDTCPADLLGALANSMSVDVWDERWPETKKREVCRNALHLHRIKTTLAGIKAHVALTGAEVRRAIRPPGRGFLRGVMTDEQRAAWLESLPQVRVYPFYHRSIAKSRQFLGRSFHATSTRAVGGVGLYSPILPGLRRVTETSHTPTGFLRPSRGRALYGRRATFYDRGVETDVAYEALDGGFVDRVLITGNRRRSWHSAGTFSKYLTGTNAARNVVTLRFSDTAALAAIAPGLEPVDVRPVRVSQSRIAPAPRSFFGRFHGYPPGSNAPRRFLKSTHAPLLIYDRVSLHDETRLGSRRKTRSYHGHGRFGIPPFTAELRIFVPMQRSKRRMGRWHKVGFSKAADMTPLRRAIEAVRVSKAFRDTVLIDTAVHGQVKFTGGLRFGEFNFGEIKEVQ